LTEKKDYLQTILERLILLVQTDKELHDAICNLFNARAEEIRQRALYYEGRRQKKKVVLR